MIDALTPCIELLDSILCASAQNRSEHPEDALLRFTRAFTSLSDDEKGKLRKLLSPPELRKVVSMSARASERAINDHDPDFATSALMIHDLEEFRDDPRDNLPYLAMTYHAAQRLRLDADELFRKVAQTMSPRSRQYVLEYVARPDDLKSLEVMRIRVENTPDGVRFLRRRAS